MKLLSAVATNIGKVAEKNEDNFYIDGEIREDLDIDVMDISHEETESGVFAVFDGLGGEQFGQDASYIAAKSFKEMLYDDTSASFDSIIQTANKRICNEIVRRSVNRMGSTVVGLRVRENFAEICNIGDSRAYLFYGNLLTKLSEDHRSRSAIASNILTQHLGIFPDEFIIEPFNLNKLLLEEGMIFILCSDGLTDYVSDYQIQRSLNAYKGGSPLDISKRLLDMALDNGGLDNITVLVVKIV